MDKETKKEFNNLAGMIKRGFDDVDKRFDGVDKRFDKVESRLDNLEDGHEAIELRLGNLAPQFEVNDLKERVEKLELAREL
ncbi:hypothetical protein KKB98_00825 [Patescibacteria group bacterium]|nr:hypothetical protein [Patescibacteria group bacterium]